MNRLRIAVPLLAAVVLLGAGCGNSGKSSSAPASSSNPGALSAEANSAATGDIPDNQVFLVFRNSAGGYSIKYPEGWTQRGSGKDVTFQDKNNLVHIAIAGGSTPTPGAVAAELKRLKSSNRTLKFRQPSRMKLGAGEAVKAVYTTRSAPNPVTGKRVTLMVDRYELGNGARRAVVDLGTPVGVDNVDAYRLMIQSFRWR